MAKVSCDSFYALFGRDKLLDEENFENSKTVVEKILRNNDYTHFLRLPKREYFALMLAFLDNVAPYDRNLRVFNATKKKLEYKLIEKRVELREGVNLASRYDLMLSRKIKRDFSNVDKQDVMIVSNITGLLGRTSPSELKEEFEFADCLVLTINDVFDVMFTTRAWYELMRKVNGKLEFNIEACKVSLESVVRCVANFWSYSPANIVELKKRILANLPYSVELFESDIENSFSVAVIGCEGEAVVELVEMKLGKEWMIKNGILIEDLSACGRQSVQLEAAGVPPFIARSGLRFCSILDRVDEECYDEILEALKGVVGNLRKVSFIDPAEEMKRWEVFINGVQ